MKKSVRKRKTGSMPKLFASARTNNSKRRLTLFGFMLVAVLMVLAMFMTMDSSIFASQTRLFGVGKTTFPVLYDYEIVKRYNHDYKAFTQGFQFDRLCQAESDSCRDIFLESTGMYGSSTVRKVDLASGKVLSLTGLNKKYFGEGLTRQGDLIYQLTWEKPLVLVYDLNLTRVGEKVTPLRDGWGLTTDGTDLIMTDSGSSLFWIDPATFELKKSVDVKDGDKSIWSLNELEWIAGKVWANIWMKDCLAKINPTTGKVEGWLDLQALTKEAATRMPPEARHRIDVLNGIAFDSENERFFVTGKYWPVVYEIKIKQANNPSQDRLNYVQNVCTP